MLLVFASIVYIGLATIKSLKHTQSSAKAKTIITRFFKLLGLTAGVALLHGAISLGLAVSPTRNALDVLLPTLFLEAAIAAPVLFLCSPVSEFFKGASCRRL